MLVGSPTRAPSLPRKGRGLRVEVDAPRRAAAQRRSSVVSGEACGPVQVVSIAAQRTRWAKAKMALYGHPDAMANLIRRTLMVTRAPILNSLRRMAPQVASAHLVVAAGHRRQKRLEQHHGSPCRRARTIAWRPNAIERREPALSACLCRHGQQAELGPFLLSSRSYLVSS